MKIVPIVGARPQFIKIAPLSRLLRRYFSETIIHTGQHYDYNMSETFFNELDIPQPDINLNVGSGNHGFQTGQMIIAIEKELISIAPDLVIVVGDTNTTLAGVLAAAKLGIKTTHLEAGLRSYNRKMPEELNRILTDHASDLLLAPTETAHQNLTKEGLADQTFLSGDITVDLLSEHLPISEEKSDILSKLKLQKKDYSLLTLHRPYNVDNQHKLEMLFSHLSKLSTTMVFPGHPRTLSNIRKFGLDVPDNIKLIDPVGYLDFLKLQKHAGKILTDSGGIQKEAYILGKPCITIRPETEWIETVEKGWNILVNPEDKNMTKQIENFSPSGSRENLFGSDVSSTIVEYLKNWLI